MADNEELHEMTFAHLAEYHTADRRKAGRGNVIKAQSVRIAGNQRVGIVESDKDQPVVVLHREGDVVTGAEFMCQCGRRATLSFEYEDK